MYICGFSEDKSREMFENYTEIDDGFNTFCNLVSPHIKDFKLDEVDYTFLYFFYMNGIFEPSMSNYHRLVYRSFRDRKSYVYLKYRRYDNLQKNAYIINGVNVMDAGNGYKIRLKKCGYSHVDIDFISIILGEGRSYRDPNFTDGFTIYDFRPKNISNCTKLLRLILIHKYANRLNKVPDEKFIKDIIDPILKAVSNDLLKHDLS